MVGNAALVVALVAGLGFLWAALKLYRSLELADARRLMFASFLYLPLVQIAYVLDQL